MKAKVEGEGEGEVQLDGVRSLVVQAAEVGSGMCAAVGKWCLVFQLGVLEHTSKVLLLKYLLLEPLQSFTPHAGCNARVPDVQICNDMQAVCSLLHDCNECDYHERSS